MTVDGARVKRGTGRELLIDAAWELWSGQGPEATTITAICDRAGVSQATFFYHFQSVAGIIAERVEVRSKLDRFRDRLIGEDLSTTEALDGLVRLALEGMMALSAPVLSELISILITNQELFDRFNTDQLMVRETMMVVYQRAKARGELSADVDPARMSYCGVALALMALMEWIHGQLADDEVHGEVMARLAILHCGTLQVP